MSDEKKADWYDVNRAFDKLVENATEEMIDADPAEILGTRKLVKWLRENKNDFIKHVFNSNYYDY